MKRFIIIILGVVWSGGGPMRGQSALPSGTPTIHVLSDSIEVPVLALKPPFRVASGLGGNDFVIRLDGGPPFHPSHTRIEGAEPLRLNILVEADTRDSRLLAHGLQAAVEGWGTDSFSASDRLSVNVYGCRLIRSLHDGGLDPAGRHEVLRAVLLPVFEAAMEGGSSCSRPPTDQPLEAAIDQIGKAAGWKAVLFVMNGEQRADAKSLERVQALAAAEGVTLFAIKYLHSGRFPAAVNSDSEGINLLVSSLGGITLPSSFDDLGQTIETIVNDLRQRYILSFPRPGNGSAGVHRLAIESTARGVRVLSSAAAAPLIDTTHCASDPDNWVCSEERPRYGTDHPQR